MSVSACLSVCLSVFLCLRLSLSLCVRVFFFSGALSDAGAGAGSVTSLRAALQALAADAMSQDGDNILGVEVLWTPSERGSSLSEREVIEDYPELLRI